MPKTDADLTAAQELLATAQWKVERERLGVTSIYPYTVSAYVELGGRTWRLSAEFDAEQWRDFELSARRLVKEVRNADAGVPGYLAGEPVNGMTTDG